MEQTIFPKIQSTSLYEFLLHGIRYVFPAKIGGLTRGIPTSYAAPILRNEIVSGNDPIPVWPHSEGNEKGLALEPPCFPMSAFFQGITKPNSGAF